MRSHIGASVLLRPEPMMSLYLETRVNTRFSSDQNLPAISSLADGGWVVTWTGAGQDGDGYGVYAQHYAADGGTVGREFQVNTFTTDDQYAPAITTLDDGGWLITWASDGQDGSGFGIYAQRFAADGSLVDDEFKVNSYTTGDQSGAHASALSDGGWVITWSSDGQDGSGYGIYQQRFDKDGNTVGSETRVSTTAMYSQFDSSVTALAGGGWVVSYSNSIDVYMQLFDAAGRKLGTETKLGGPGTYVPENVVISLADGGFAVLYSGDQVSGLNYQLFDADGQSRQTQPFAFSADEQPINLSAAALEDGGFIFSWSMFDGSNRGVYMQRCDANGDLVGTIEIVNSVTENEQSYSAVTALEDGGWIVTWRSYDAGNMSFDVYMQRYNADGGKVSITAPTADDSSIATLEDASYTFSMDDFGFADADSDTLAAIIIETLPESGSLKLNGESVAADTEIAVSDLDKLVWTPDKDQNGTDAASFEFSVIDSYGTKSKHSYAISFDIAAVADLPIAADGSVTVIEDNSYSFSSADFSFADVDGDALQSVTITELPQSGTLTLNGIAVTANQVIDADQIANLAWTPDADANGQALAAFAFTVTDETGDRSASTYRMSFDVENVNDAPVATGKTITINEDARYQFSISDFAFTDIDGDAFGAVIITTLPTTGKLMLNGTAVKAGQAMLSGDISDLVWRPAANDYGKNLASFTFQVADEGGRAHGGIDRSFAAATIRFDVKDVVDGFTGTSHTDWLTGTIGSDIVDARGGNDLIRTGAGNDQLTGGLGKDRMLGGAGADRFIFSDGDGRDTITDFSASGRDHDVLDLSDCSAIDSWKDLVRNHIKQVDDDVLLTIGTTDSVTLENVWIRALDRADFAF